MRRLRTKIQQKKKNDVRTGSEPVLAFNLAEITTPNPGSIAAAAVEEQPLPFVMGEMALWGVGMATLLIPFSVLGLVVSPLLAAGNIFLPTRESAVAA